MRAWLADPLHEDEGWTRLSRRPRSPTRSPDP